MADRVPLLVEASQDQQNNSAKLTETVPLFVYFDLYVYFAWSPTVHFKKGIMRAQQVGSRILVAAFKI